MNLFVYTARSLAAMSVLALSACDSSTGPVQDLLRAQRQWMEHAPASYSLTIRRGCFCPVEAIGPVVVTVENGTVTSRVYALTGQPVPSQLAGAFPDVAGLFSAIERGRQERYYKLEVEYDSALGYPKSVNADVEKNTADDEFSLLVTDFTSR